MTARWLVLWLLIVAACASLLMAIATRPAHAADCSTYDEVLAHDRAEGANPFEIPAKNLPKIVADLEAITGDTYEPVTRAFFIMLPDLMIYGLEANGCLYAPILIARPPADAGA
jgi:hypothetical protein